MSKKSNNVRWVGDPALIAENKSATSQSPHEPWIGEMNIPMSGQGGGLKKVSGSAQPSKNVRNIKANKMAKTDPFSKKKVVKKGERPKKKK